MTASQAQGAAESKRSDYQIPGQARSHAPNRAWIELGHQQADGRWLVRDVLVWIVRFTLPAAWIDLAVSDHSGEVVRVSKSRGYVLRYQNSQEPIVP